MCHVSFIMPQCRSLTNAMSGWAGRGRAAPSPAPSSSSASAPGTTKGVNTAVAAVAAAYNDKCKQAHEIAVQGSQALSGVRSALTTYLRQGGDRAQGSLPDLASLGCAELKAAGNSYRSVGDPADVTRGSVCVFVLCTKCIAAGGLHALGLKPCPACSCRA